jgi:glycosyltransferase involved in cell wall biosynthesis
VSEADNGIYDAMNKGVAMAGGDIVGILNSDDFYADNTVIEKVVKAFQDSKCDAVYGDLVYIDGNQSNKVVRKWVAGSYNKNLFYKGWMPPHPTVFIRREIYEKYGLFNLKFKSSSDYELLLRLMFIKNIKVEYIPQVLVNMRIGGQSTKSVSNRCAAHAEDYRAWIFNGVWPKWYTVFMKPLSKIGQFRTGANNNYSNQLTFKNFYPERTTS